MRTATRILMALAALLATCGIAAAQCLECDVDGEPGDSGSYTSADAGAATDKLNLSGDSDLSMADSDEAFWLWLALCLSAFVDGIEEILGVDSGADANVEGYASQHGVDLDAAVTLAGPACDAAGKANEAAGKAKGALPRDAADKAPAVPCSTSFDGGPAGDLDGKTWEAMGGVHDATGAQDVMLPADGDAVDGAEVDGCVTVDVAAC